MNIKNLDKQEKALIVAGICGLIMLFGIFFLYNEFKNIDKDGVKCLQNPLTWAEYRMKQDQGHNYQCVCQLDNGRYYPFWNGGDNGSTALP